MTAWTLLWILPVLAIEGVFSGSEIALMSADRVRLQKLAAAGSRGAKTALLLIKNPEMIFATTLLMTNVCITLISLLTTLYFVTLGAENAELYAVAITSPLVVLFGELVPKTLYRRFCERTAPRISLVVYVTFHVFYPITWVLRRYTHRLAKFFSPFEEFLSGGKRRNTRDEVRTILSSVRKDSEISTSEKRMIKRIFEFKEAEAKNTLIPLVKVDAIENTATVAEALKAFKDHRHSRMPVYAERVDNIIGVIRITDLLSITDLQATVARFLAPAHYVAETQSLHDLMGEMKDENTEMVVVVDEYGGAVGILTLEDIIEEIVGDIQDEYDTERPAFKPIDTNEWLIEGRMEVKQLNEQIPIELPIGEYETIAGFLLQQFGRIPAEGDELYFDTPSGNWRFIIKGASERRITQVLATLVQPSQN